MEHKTNTKGKLKKALIAAFPHTIPIFAGFWFLGLTYGIYMNVSGFSFLYPMIMSLTIFAGSVEFVAVSMLLGAFAPLQSLVMTLMINARHLFYGISMLDKFRGLGLKKLYLIFGMCDESFSINYTASIPEDVDAGWFMFFVTLLNQIYWFTGSTLGGIFGSLIHFNTEGLDFVMTAMFVVIFMEQWLKDRRHESALLGLGLSLFCLLIFGADNFIIPSMITILAALTAVRGPLTRAQTPAEEGGAENDTDRTDYHHQHGSSGNRDHPVSAVSRVPGGQTHAGIYQVSGKSAAAGSIRALSHLLPENVSLFAGSHGIPEFISIALVIALHLWKRQMLLSIAGGTICYMALVQTIF